MIEKRIRATRIVIVVSFILSLIFVALTALLIIALLYKFYPIKEEAELGLAMLFYILTIISIYTYSLFARHMRVLKTTTGFLVSLFGNSNLNVYDEEEFKKKARKIRLEEGKTLMIFGFTVKSIGGGGSLSSIGTSLLYAINQLVYTHAQLSVTNHGGFVGIDSHNNYFFAFVSGDPERSIDIYRKNIFALSSEFEKRDDIPYTSFLLSCAQTTDRRKANETFENCRYALWRNANSRVSGDLLIYDEELRAEENRQKELDVELERALKNEELIIYYQAKYSLVTNQFFGAEALLRWKHPKRGLLPPAVFIPYCENSGKIVEIDRYVYEHVCRDLADWRKEGQRKLVVSVNLSRRSVYDPGLLEFLESTLKKNAIDPSTLDIELTESLAAQNLTFIRDIIRRIKKLGVETSIDDFGVGYSSLSSLKNISFDVLKIDKSFVDDIEVDPKAISMISSIIQMAHDFGMSVIAEGVETSSQNDILKKLGLDSIQGYYYSRPSDKAHFDALLADNPFEKEGGNEA